MFNKKWAKGPSAYCSGLQKYSQCPECLFDVTATKRLSEIKYKPPPVFPLKQGSANYFSLY